MAVIFPEIDIRLALSLVRPGVHHGWIGNTDSGYATLADAIGEWRDSQTTMPTDNELLTAWQAYVDAKAQTDAIAALQAAVQASAKTDIQGIPNWASWTQAQWETYYNANLSPTQVNAVASLADAKVILNKQSAVIENLAKVIIALRNHIFPDLQS